ncbi:aldehyde ferredoxin oxidoreductase family protein [Thermus sp.]|uniref:aldehyde ferredoxin oxidoreductase family protein n=1 Tax=Thermus sp. TaxID=275 RepID=UPI002634333D|nr:aldehyde ferredoxin oxidoreductase family protein [Thermus sp.]MCX7850241.1 aldehyde ferredoxin oxidoreductase family protein [Thermus sp.]
MKGVAGRLLSVDLSTGAIRTEEIPERTLRLFLGGWGLAAKLAWDRIPKGADPLGPENVVAMAPGLLTGTGIPTASKTAFSFRSPLTGTIGRSMAGAWAGVALRRAGFDALVIQGRSAEPVVLVLEDGKARLDPARDLWGLDTRATRKALLARYGEGVRTAVIGPAGERLSWIATIECDGRQAGRGGGGAVLGSKNLKAIVVKGAGEVPMAHPERIKELIRHWNAVIREHPVTEADMKYGSGEFLDWMNRVSGTFPSRNWQWGYFKSAYARAQEGKIELDPYYWAPKYSKRNVACPFCTKPCGQLFVVEGGKYGPIEVDGPEYETLYSLGGAPEIAEIEAVAKANEICDLLGIDTISAGVTVAWAMEAVERGYLKPADLDGIDLRFGNAEAMLKVLERMGRREGKAGELLADGARAAAKRLGKGEEFAIHIKGMELPAYDIRGSKGVALAFAVAFRGGDHLTAGVYGTEYGGAWWKFEAVDRRSLRGKGFQVKIHEDLMALYDVLGICKFSRHIFFLEALPDMVAAQTGLELTAAELLTVGERVYNLARAFNVREGFSRKDDHLPHRVMAEPIPEGPSAGDRVPYEELQKLLDDYYEARGWSRDGVPLKARLVALDLPEVAEAVGAKGV